MKYTAIVDYGVGNLKSVANAMAYVGQQTLVTGDAGELERADAIILPGVGAFHDAAEKLREMGLDPGNIHAPLDYICKTFVQNPLSGILPATVFNLNFLT